MQADRDDFIDMPLWRFLSLFRPLNIGIGGGFKTLEQTAEPMFYEDTRTTVVVVVTKHRVPQFRDHHSCCATHPLGPP